MLLGNDRTTAGVSSNNKKINPNWTENYVNLPSQPKQGRGANAVYVTSTKQSLETKELKSELTEKYIYISADLTSKFWDALWTHMKKFPRVKSSCLWEMIEHVLHQHFLEEWTVRFISVLYLMKTGDKAGKEDNSLLLPSSHLTSLIT